MFPLNGVSAPLPPPAILPMEEDEDSQLTNSELQLVSGLDSLQFGFLRLNSPENSKKKALVLKTINQIERMLIESNRQKELEPSPDAAFPVAALDSANEKKIVIEPKTYCKLGHFHLLLEDYEKAMSAYQKYANLAPKDKWNDSAFLYGLGLCYYFFNAYVPATKEFQNLLYSDPSFLRANEVHLRLGLMRKIEKNLPRALRSFNNALKDQNPCTFTKSEIKFHIAHLYETVNKPKIAKDHYEALLKEKDLSTKLRATIFQNLGWISHTCEEIGDKSQRDSLAIHFLQKALESDPRSGQSLYLLGRCFSSVGKVHDAFLAYRNSVDKSEGNADTWCSIGVLYQQQNQPLDALQAYICAVQLDKFHVSAWTNLGYLYESVSQPRDALSCFVNAGRGHLTKHSFETMNPSLQSRIQFIQTGLAKAPPQTVSNKPRHLPVIEEAWNLPISAEMTARQQQQQSQRFQQKGTIRTQETPQSEIPIKRYKVDESIQNANNLPVALSPNQMSALQAMQNYINQRISLTPQQNQLYTHLSQQYKLFQAHQQQLQNQQRNNPVLIPTNGLSRNTYNTPPEIHQNTIQTRIVPGNNMVNNTEMDVKSPRSAGALSGSPPFSPDDQDIQAWFNQKDLNLGDDLLKGCNVDFDDIDLMDEDDLVGMQSNNNNPEEKPDTRVRTISVNSENNQYNSITETEDLSIDLSSKDLQRRCKADFKDLRKITMCNIMGDVAPPEPPEPPNVQMTEAMLYPQTPSVFVENKKDAFSPMLQEFCLQHPIAVVRGIAAALKLDLGLFSTRSLVEAHPTHDVEIRFQNFKNYDENVDSSGSPSWDCFSRRAQSTVQVYAAYQAQSFISSAQEQEDGRKESDSDSKDSSGNKKKKPIKQLRFGTNVDLSDEKKWMAQLQELKKLPAFAQVVSAGNMLTHVGHPILGMNTVQLYMKVRGSRTPGHQENNNFCSININIGPGDCEWFAVPNDYWGKIFDLCERNRMEYLHGSWWPNLTDCAKAKIPVYRFTQKPGDLVWVNSGCVHWVQSMGWCNNIAWNVGPLTARQFYLGIERYEWNKLQNFKSIVPMIHLSWNLARNIHPTDPKLFDLVKSVLMRTLSHCIRLLEFVKSKDVTVRFHGRTKTDASHYCGRCELEVFNYLFIEEQERRQHVVHCVNCAIKTSPDLKTFVVLEEYRLEELMKVYDEFVLYKLPTAHPPFLLSSVVSASLSGPPRIGFSGEFSSSASSGL